MSTWLHVAEKPSVARRIASELSNNRFSTVNSLSQYNPVFSFRYNNTNFLVTSVTGHVMQCDFTAEARNWQTYEIARLFLAPIRKYVPEDKNALKNNIQKLAKGAQKLVLWLDCDREGENICFEVMQLVLELQQQHPNNHAQRGIVVERAVFSALTANHLRHAIEHLTQPNSKLSDAVEARQEIDLRVGAVFTRFQTLSVRQMCHGNLLLATASHFTSNLSAAGGLNSSNNSAYITNRGGGSFGTTSNSAGDLTQRILSFGSCQFPTLGFVVRRFYAQRGFVPEDYYTLHMEAKSMTFRSARGTMYDYVSATCLYEDMLEAAAADQHRARVIDVQKRRSSRWAPVPLATVEMQKLAATHLRMSATQCMDLAEKLYQQGFISYPRTETNSFAYSRAELMELVRTQTESRDVGEFATSMLAEPEERTRMPRTGTSNDKAHPPIHPTKVYNGDNKDVAGLKQKLYNLIVRHFLACLSPDAVAASTTVRVEYGDEQFTASGVSIEKQGWLEVFTYIKWYDRTIPSFQCGNRFVPTAVLLNPGRTTPPPSLTETNLIALMDKNGIGTDATIATHIDTLEKRGYIERKGQCLVPTTLGVALASAYEKVQLHELLQPTLRARMERAMCQIASGTKVKDEVVRDAVQSYQIIFDKLHQDRVSFCEEVARCIQENIAAVATIAAE